MDSSNPGQSRQSTAQHTPSTFRNRFDTQPHRLSLAIVLALGTLTAATASLGAGSCTGSGTTVINGAQSQGCRLGHGASLNVMATGAIEPAAEPAVSVQGVTARRIVNQGVLAGVELGVSIVQGALSAGLNNALGATISGASSAVLIENSRVDGGLRNTGTLNGSLILRDSHLTGGLDNAGSIAASQDHAIGLFESTLTGNLRNSASLSAASAIRLDGSRLEGSLINAGNLSGGSYPLFISGGTVITGDLVNTGTLWGDTRIVDSLIEGAFINSSGGVLRNNPTALTVWNSTIAGGFINQGTINTGSGITLDNDVLGGFVNTGTLYVSSGDLAIRATTIKGNLVNSGSIASSEVGFGAISLYNGVVTGNVVNSGSLDAGYFGSAIRVWQGQRVQGDVVNAGEIIGYTGFDLADAQVDGGLYNTGRLDGLNRDAFLEGVGVSVVNSTVGGDLSNSGTLKGRAQAVTVRGSSIRGNVVNSGAMLSARTTIALESSSLGGSLFNSGTLGVDPDLRDDIPDPTTSAITLRQSSARNLLNSGTIRGKLWGLNLEQSQLSGRITNAADALLSGTAGAIRLLDSDVDGGIVNEGSLSGETLVLIENSTLGGLRNSADLQLAEAGFSFQGSTVNGDIRNVGDLAGGYTAMLVDSTAVNGSLRNAGRIDAGSYALLVQNGSRISGDIVNTGSLYGYTQISGSTVAGALINTSTGIVQGNPEGFGIFYSTLEGGIVNRGRIHSGEGISIRGSVLGGIFNSGEMDVSSGALYIGGTQIRGDILNSGVLGNDSDGYGGVVLTQGSLTGNFDNRGELRGGYQGTALQILDNEQVSGSLLNSGWIWGGQGILLDRATVVGDLRNEGTITGFNAIWQDHGAAVQLEQATLAGNLRNSGTMTGVTYGLRLSGTNLGGSLINSGRIASADAALVIENSTIAGHLKNAGYIGVDSSISPDFIKAQSNGLLIRGSTVEGLVSNSGQVMGNRVGLRVTDSTLKHDLINTGTLSGRNYSLYVDATSTLANLYIGGKDSARFDGAVYAPNTVATLYRDATYTLAAQDHWTLDSFVNRGTLNLAAPSARAAAPATFNGDYDQRSGAVLRTQVLDQTHYGKLIVTGTATLPSDARIDVDVANASQPFNVSQLADVLSAGTLKSDGSFAVTGNSALFDFGAIKDGNTVDLTLSAKSATGVSRTATEAGLEQAAGLARALDAELAKGTASPLTPYFVSATSEAQVANALTQALPIGNASLRASQAVLGEINQALQDRLLPASTQGVNPRPSANLWARPFTRAASGGHGSSGNNGQVIGLDSQLGPGRRLGVAFAYANGDTQGDALGGARDSHLGLWQFSGYSAYTLAPDTELMLYAGAGQGTVQGARGLTLGGASGKARADYDSLVATFGASLGHAYAFSDSTRLTPSLRLDYNHIREEGYREQGNSAIAPLLLSVDARQTDQLIAGLDGRLEHRFADALGGAGSRLQLSLGVGYDLINDPGSVTARFASVPGQRFEARAGDPSPWLARGALSLVTPLTANGAELSVNYSAQSRSDYDEAAATVKVVVPF